MFIVILRITARTSVLEQSRGTDAAKNNGNFS